jgi:Holliday junction resolvase
MRKRARTDENHKEIVEALRKSGWQVMSLAEVGGGAPDLLAWHAYRGLRLIEVKAGKGDLTLAQKLRVAQGWPIKVIRTVDEALAL